MIWGVHISRAVYVAAELGVADLLAGGPMTAAQLAQATRVHEPSLYRVLRLLAALGVLAEQDGRLFGLTVLGERLRAEVPASVRSWALLVESLETAPGFEPLTELCRQVIEACVPERDGQIPGTAQLAPTASASPALPAESKTTNSPVRASTAVTLRILAGQSLAGSRAWNTLRRSDSDMVRAASAQRPIRTRARTGSRLVLMTHSSLPMTPQPIRAAGSGSGGAS